MVRCVPTTEPIAPVALAMRTRPESALARLLVPYFGEVTIAPEAADRLRDAYANGIVVHVLRAKRVIAPLYVRYALGRLGLPKPAWMHDHHASEHAATAQSLVDVAARGEPSLLFLRRPVTL